MSQRRNTSTPPSRRRTAPAGALALAVAGLAACAADPVSPPDAAGVAVAGAAPSLAIAIDRDAAKRLTAAALTTLATTWRTTSADIEAPTTAPLDLACGVRGVYTVSQRVGRAGGALKFGRSELRIPPGALAADVTITATITLGAGVDVTFAPHGLRFAAPAELRVDWTGCTTPFSGAPINLYYTNDSGLITQVMPSARTSSTTARMLTDHFSGYTVGWGRR